MACVSYSYTFTMTIHIILPIAQLFSILNTKSSPLYSNSHI